MDVHPGADVSQLAGVDTVHRALYCQIWTPVLGRLGANTRLGVQTGRTSFVLLTYTPAPAAIAARGAMSMSSTLVSTVESGCR